MLNYLKDEANLTNTMNGAVTYSSSKDYCLDLFFKAGAMRNSEEKEIEKYVTRAFAQDPSKTLKILFFARDIRFGLGERRFFRTAVKYLAKTNPDAVNRNIKYFGEYGRYDDLLSLFGTQCEKNALDEIKSQFSADREALNSDGNISLLAKWLPSVNASSAETNAMGRKVAKYLGLNEKAYRRSLSDMRKRIDIIENHLRTSDYTFCYSKQPSCAMMKYRKAFLRNDEEHYLEYIKSVEKGKATINTSALYPYNIVHSCLKEDEISEREKKVLDVTWKNLPKYGENEENALAVVDGSGSMYWGRSNLIPAEVALSLGIYFAEHNKGAFKNHFITFSMNPRLIEIKGDEICQKVKFCESFNECANTDIEAVFRLILSTAVKNRIKQSEMPSKIYIISDMEFDCCVKGGNSDTIFNTMKKNYMEQGYKLPQIVFWNVNSLSDNIPVSVSDTGVAIVSGATPAIFDMVAGGELSPLKVMNDIINGERYAPIM